MRVSWQFYGRTLNSLAAFQATNSRQFSYDQQYFDHFNLGPSQVCDCNHADTLNRYRVTHDVLKAHAYFIASALGFTDIYYNVINLREQTSGAPEPLLDLPDEEVTRPSVFVLNHANAHTGKYQVCLHTIAVVPVLFH